jgi:hypothetical protein
VTKREENMVLGLALLCAISMPALAWANAPAPHDITDFYQLLAQDKDGIVDPVIEKQGSTWKFKASTDSGEVNHKVDPVVDLKNGYLLLDYAVDPCDSNHTEVALFNAKGGRKFIGIADKDSCIESDGSSIRFYEFTGASYRDASKEMGALSTLGMQDFLDEKYVKSQQAKDDRLAEVAYLGNQEVKLPRVGTTVEMRMENSVSSPTGVPEQDYKAATEILRKHRKYSVIELSWSAADGKFTVAKKK